MEEAGVVRKPIVVPPEEGRVYGQIEEMPSFCRFPISRKQTRVLR